MRVRWSPARMVILLVVGLNVTAIYLGRLAGPSPSWRSREGVRHVSINYYLSKESEGRDLRYLDLATGRLGRLELPEGDLLDQASWSPWVDQDGRSQVVGRWASRSGKGTEKVNRGFGLARMTFPGGEILDKVDTEVQPGSPACWFPDTSARILFAGGDGAIYRFAFDGPVGPRTTETGRDLKPSPLAWAAQRPGGGHVYLGEPCWPSNIPGPLDGRLFVSLAHERKAGEKLAISTPALWSLKIDGQGTTIESAERLIAPKPGGIERHERFPAVCIPPDGPPILAFLAREPSDAAWRLWIAPLDLSGSAPRVDPAAARVVAEGCLPMPPILSSDGRWVTCSTTDVDGEVRIRRLPVPIRTRPASEEHLIARQNRSPHS